MVNSSSEQQAKNLAANLLSLRQVHNISQKKLSVLSGIPRSTLTYFESGQGNPTLKNLVALADSLGVGIEELLQKPRAEVAKIPLAQIPVKKKRGIRIYKLLPDSIPGMEIDKMEIESGGIFPGSPHVPGSREYMTLVQGELTVAVYGEKFLVEKGEVLAFPGDSPHSYKNTGRSVAIAVSVVVTV